MASVRFRVGVVFALRNVGIATDISATVLAQVEFAGVAMADFLAQVLLLLPVA